LDLLEFWVGEHSSPLHKQSIELALIKNKKNL